jgi:putative solute:sodium symporter small subunit
MNGNRRHQFWLRVKSLTAALLGVWLFVTLAAPWWARELNALTWFGFPLGFWLVAQGALLVYLGIIVVYVLAMDRLEAACLDAGCDDRGQDKGAT